MDFIDNKYLIRVLKGQGVRTCAKILAYVTYVSIHQKAYIRHCAFYLVIFLTHFPKLVLT